MRLPEDRSLLTSAISRGQALETAETRVFFIATTRRKVGSITFTLNGETLNVENKSPYETYSMLLPEDQQTLCAQGHSRRDQGGISGTPYCIAIRYNPAAPMPLEGHPGKDQEPSRATMLLPRTWYGSGLYATNNANEPIRDTALSIEFESPASGTLLAFQTFFIYKYAQPGAYHDGDGGKYRISLYEVDSNGKYIPQEPLNVMDYSPSLRVLNGSSKSSNANTPSNRYGEDVRFKLLTLRSRPFIQAGKRYALVFENIHPQKNLNWLSLNGLAAMHGDAPGDGFIAPEFRGALSASQVLIYRRGEELISYNIPVFGLQYDLDGNGTVDYTFGGGYHEAGYIPDGRSHPDSRVTRNQTIREIFTPETSITVKGLSIFAGECGQGGKLRYALKSNSGTVLISGDFNSLKASCSTMGLREAFRSFPSSLTLTAHAQYSLEFSTDGSSTFYIPIIRHGGNGSLSYIRGAGTRFQDGRGQVGMINAETTIWREIRNQSMNEGGAPADYSFYFVTEPYVSGYEPQ
jgi:hypothetical protein